MKGCIPTPNVSMNKLLLSSFDIVEINEFNTSKLYNKTLKEILTSKEKTKCGIFVNRDTNACKNILLLGKY